MKNSKLYRFVTYYSQFFPVKINFIILLSIIGIGFQIVNGSKNETNSFSVIAVLLCKIALVFVLFLMLFSLITVLYSWLRFKINLKRNQQDSIHVKLNENGALGAMKLEVKLPFVYSPILGNVGLKFLYEHHHFTQSVQISEKIDRRLLSLKKGLKQSLTFNLPDVKAYHFSKAFLKFEDMLHLFSLKVQMPINEYYNNHPQANKMQLEELPPKKTESEEVRIEQLRKVEGEYLNYKKFEDSDDVRRIVWKLFAKNKELVVRIPETMDPFASHIYMYASFFNSFDFQSNSLFHQAMLNRYKNVVWSIFDTLSVKDYEVRYLSDQMTESKIIPGPQVLNEITQATWQNEIEIEDYFKPKIGSVLCIHSLTNLEHLTQILSKCDAQTNIFFVQLSSVFQSKFVANWMSYIFLKPDSDGLSKLKNSWPLMPLKFSLKRNEHELISFLEKQNINLQII